MPTETIYWHGSTYKKGSHGFVFRVGSKSSGREWLKSSMTIEGFDQYLKAEKERAARAEKSRQRQLKQHG